MRTVYFVTALLLGAFALTQEGAGQNVQKPAADDLPEVKDLPNPFTFRDGSPVRTREDWGRRRTEIKDLFQDYMYGHIPPKDEANKVIVQDLEVTLEHEGKTLIINVKVALPSDATGKVPVLIQNVPFGKGGGAAGAKRFAAYTSRGYAVAEFSFNQAAGDNKTTSRNTGVYKLFGDQIDCSVLLAWAWGISRVIDVLETVPEIDITKVFITGHSRDGKAVLIAGAFDERIALTVPSHSGAGGMSPYRFIYGKAETLQNIVSSFPHWFRPDFKQFIGKVDRLPVDQHLLAAMVAPRALMDTEGTQDAWTNPEGAQLTNLAAKKVYSFLNAGDKISFRYRPVGHVPSVEDLLAYADHVFFGKALPADFGKMAYKEETKAFKWDVPK